MSHVCAGPRPTVWLRAPAPKTRLLGNALACRGGINGEEKDGENGARKDDGITSGHKGIDVNHERTSYTQVSSLPLKP